MINNDKVGYITSGPMAKGCRQCIEGEKLVLFITGLCGQRCSYCPVSEKKFGEDDIYANEWKIKSKDDLLEEARLMNAKGAGITGGDPLATLAKTCEYIKFLKDNKGKDFHIHLYTPLQLVKKEVLQKLYDAGLDEIRFHPDVSDDKDWKRIELANEFNWSVGVEIPCLPDKEKETKKLLDYLLGKVEFVNLNELEVSDTEVKHYNMGDYRTRDEQTYAVAKSKETAINLIEYAENKGIKLTVYFCSAKLKDKTQMGKRIIRRAKGVAKNYDKVTEEGMLIRGAIYLDKLSPGANYHEILEKLTADERKKILAELKEKYDWMKRKLFLRNSELDEEKLRILTKEKEARRLVKKLKRLPYVVAVVEEYPTKDSVEVEIEILSENQYNQD